MANAGMSGLRIGSYGTVDHIAETQQALRKNEIVHFPIELDERRSRSDQPE